MSVDPAHNRPDDPSQRERPHPVPPHHESPEDAEARRWLEEVYQGDHVRQLSVRSIVSGMAIGAVMSISNLYVGLKTGWGLGVTITACIIAYAVFKTLEAVIPAYHENHFTILENNTMSSAASAAGYMASAGLVSAFPALYLTTGRVLLWWEMMLWLGAVSVLGVFMAVPLKRQLINIDKLPFPTGLATAETLRSMHEAGAEAMQKAKALFAGAGAGALLAVWRDAPFMGRFAFPGSIPLFPGERGKALEERLTLGFEGSLIMVAAGAIMGIRVGVSLLVGAILYYGIIGPVLIDQGVAEPGYRGLVSWVLWPATAMMVTSGLLAFGMRWRTVLRAFSSLGAVFGGKRAHHDPLAHVEVPGSWFLWGTLLSGAVCVLMGHYLFEVTWWMGIVAVLATFMLSIVAARATGETDVTPVGALGKITQLVYGVVAPSNMTTNLMTASITAGAAAHSADLLTDLKSGYMLGGSPRKQTIAQLFGVAAGTLLCVPVYTIVAKPEKLGSAELPAPAAKVWAAVAEMLAKGLNALPPGAVAAMIVGGIVGILITLGEEFFPKYRKWIPSATGLGIAGVIPAFNSISMFLGAIAAWILMKKKPETNDRYTIAVASGLIAGESLMGVAIILWLQGPEMIQEIIQHLLGG
ncbi:MAG TPA: OPT family oligopeptide transporter [Vulgatibacter sp.]|nr:OPT family oligopeptide transporter [Vulgatibacter sp.]